MAIPDYQSIMLPLLEFSGDQKEHSLRETIEFLSSEFNLTEDERKERLPSGRAATFDNRVGWARTYLKKAGLLESTKRAHLRITSRGLDVLQQNPEKIDNKFLKQYPEFIEFQTSGNKTDKPKKPEEDGSQTPEEEIEEAYQRVRQELAYELLQTVIGCSPMFFEQLVVDLIVKMGYGGTRRDAGTAIGKSGDGGIDGIIKEDRLGLDVVYIQAKHWDGTSIGRPEIQKFAGALQGKRARKGIFITTSTFTKSAYEYASSIDTKIVLIDGGMLTQLMIDFNIGVNAVAAYELKRIDTDYFTGE
jgi:restriction system protein